MNATKYGGFAETILPVARKKYGRCRHEVNEGYCWRGCHSQELLEYAWTQEGVASATVGHWGIEPLQENLKIAQEYVGNPIARLDREALENRFASYAGPRALCWDRPGYRDGNVVVS